MQGDARLAVVVGGAERERFGITSGEILREMHAVVGDAAFFAEDMNLVVRGGTQCDQLFDAVMANHAIADDDQVFHAASSKVSGVLSFLSVVSRSRCWSVMS